MFAATLAVSVQSHTAADVILAGDGSLAFRNPVISLGGKKAHMSLSSVTSL